MRKIKFRVWDLHRNRWMEEVELPKYWMETQQIGDIEEEYWYTEDNFKFMQYTGYVDEDGKEIYQGDIIQWSSDDPDDGTETWFVDPETFIGGFFAHNVDEFMMYPLQDPTFANIDPMNNKMMEYRVIGNIYENPELLEDK